MQREPAGSRLFFCPENDSPPDAKEPNSAVHRPYAFAASSYRTPSFSCPRDNDVTIKAQFAKTQREMLSETIEIADEIAVGRTALRLLTNTECRRLGDQFAAASAVVDLCASAAEQALDSPAVVGLYRRFARDYRLHAEEALMICGEFESVRKAEAHVGQIRRMMRGQLGHFDMDARILFEASIQVVGLGDDEPPLVCQPTG